MWTNLSFVRDFQGYWDMDCAEYGKLINANMFGTWVEYMENTIAGKSDLKWLMLSAHDSNLEKVLPSLNITST